MRPLPRLHAVTDDAVLALDDFGVRASAIAAAGPAVALHARSSALGGSGLASLVTRMMALARPPEASVFVNGRPDVARALDAQGVQLAAADLAANDARRVLGTGWSGWIGRSVHGIEEAEEAADEGADFLVVGSIYPSTSHPGQPAAGVALVTATEKLGLPVVAIGGITPHRAHALREAGAYGVAVIAAAWRAPDPAAAALALLEPWAGDSAR